MGKKRVQRPRKNSKPQQPVVCCNCLVGNLKGSRRCHGCGEYIDEFGWVITPPGYEPDEL